MPRVLLLSPTTSYRTDAFLGAAARLDVDVTVASERPNTLAYLNPSGLMTLDFYDPDKAADQAARFAERFPIDAVVPVDSQATAPAAAICQKLGLRHNSVEATAAARNKHRMRQLMQDANVPIPAFQLHSIDEDPTAIGRHADYPCVLKPLHLSASQGVIRVDDPGQFVRAARRLGRILQEVGIKSARQDSSADAESRKPSPANDSSRQYLVECFIDGPEVAVEGIMSRGVLRVLAIFDKPDSLDGPFFAETVYVTPSRLSTDDQQDIVSITSAAARAIGLTEGPIHAEVRLANDGPRMIEVNARSIGGHCSNVLRFGQGMGLEELIIRHALDGGFDPPQREPRSAGVMMIPVPHAGRLIQIHGTEQARSLQGIDEVIISVHPGQELVPLPEGSLYVGFVFARAETPQAVDAALRKAYSRLTISIEPSQVHPP